MKVIYRGKLVTIRPPVLADTDLICKYTATADIPRFTFVPKKNSPRIVRKFIRQTIAERKKRTTFVFAIVPHEVGHLAGMIGMMNIRRTHRADIGYWLGKKFRRKGYMAEAVKLVLKFGFHKLKLERIQASTLRDNDISGKLLLNCGFRFEGTLRGYFNHRGRSKDAKMYSILRREFGS